MLPKGKLLLIGGAEDKGEETMDMEINNIKFKRYEILKTLLATSKNKPIEIITTATTIPNVVQRSYLRVFKRIGFHKLNFINIKTRKEANQTHFLDRIQKAGAVFFSGGDQARLAHILTLTPFIKLIRKRYFKDSDFLLAGTSAGAMAMSDVMIKQGKTSEAMIAGNLILEKGLRIVSNLIIDTHFIKRGRFGRLAQAIALHPDHLGIGLGEDTAIIIKEGKLAECRGSGMVVVIDGKKIKNSNVVFAQKGEPIFVENLQVHLLVKGSQFKLNRNILGKWYE